MHSTFVAGGPGVAHSSKPIEGVRTIDLAPTIAFLLGIPGPQNARGKILYNIVPGTSSYREVTILDISDYHGQLIPLTDAPDSIGPTANIGGSAYLKPWFDTFRKEARNGSITIAAGDSVGATPADQRLLRRQADDRADAADGHQRRRPRQPQLRQGPGVPAQDAHPDREQGAREG